MDAMGVMYTLYAKDTLDANGRYTGCKWYSIYNNYNGCK